MKRHGARAWGHWGVAEVRRRLGIDGARALLAFVSGGILAGCSDQGPEDSAYSSRIRDVCSVRNVALRVMFVADTGLPPRAVGVPATLQFQPISRVNPTGPTGCAVRGDFVIDPRLPFAPVTESTRRGQFAAQYGEYFGTRPDSTIHLHFTVDVGAYQLIASLPLDPEQLGTWFASTTPGRGSIVVVSR